MAIPFAAIGLGMQAGGQVLGAFYGQQNKLNEAAVAKYNANVQRANAKAIEQRTKFQMARQAEEGQRIQGELEASIGGSGLVSTQGAPMMALALQKTELDLQNYLIGYQGRIEAGQALSAAAEYDMMNQQAKIGAKQALWGGLLSAGATAMKGWADMPAYAPKTPGAKPPSSFVATGSPASGVRNNASAGSQVNIWHGFTGEKKYAQLPSKK